MYGKQKCSQVRAQWSGVLSITASKMHAIFKATRSKEKPVNEYYECFPFSANNNP